MHLTTSFYSLFFLNFTSRFTHYFNDFKKEEAVTSAGDVEVQSEEVPKADQATNANPETGVTESSEEPVIEIAPTSNGVLAKVGEEEFVEEPPKYPAEQEEPAPAEVSDAPEEQEEEPKLNVDLSEKLASLGIESAAGPQTNDGLESHGVSCDGDAVVVLEEA